MPPTPRCRSNEPSLIYTVFFKTRVTTDLAFVTRLTDVTPPNTDTPDCHNRVFASTVGATPTGWKELEMCDVEIDKGFDVELDWGSERGSQSLPYLITVDAVPAKGTTILLTQKTRDSDVMFFSPREKVEHYAVEVEKVVLDAEDPEDTGYTVYVIPA